MSEEKKKLTPKQKMFVEKYLGDAHFNGTKAAELAGYEGSRASLSQIAYENLRKLEIRTQIDEVLSAMTMPANVVLTRLTEIAEGKVTDFYDENGKFNLGLAKENGKDHLLKKIKTKRTVRETKVEINDAVTAVLAEDEIEVFNKSEILYEEVEFEMYSAHEALRDLGKHHKLFTDKVESENLNENVNMTAEEYKKRAEERLKEANETLKEFDE